MNKKIEKSGSGAIKLLSLGLSLASLAATAYFFLGPKGKRNIENTKSWVIKMKGDVIEKLEQVQDVSEAIYNEIIDSVAAKYEENLKSSPEEIRLLAQDLKRHWPNLNPSGKGKKTVRVKIASKPIKERKGM